MLAFDGKASINLRSEVGKEGTEVNVEANIGLLKGGDIPLELKEDVLEAELEGDGLLNWLDFRFI